MAADVHTPDEGGGVPMMLSPVLLAMMLADEPVASPATPSPTPATPDAAGRSGHQFTSRLALGASCYALKTIPAAGFDAVIALGGMGKVIGWSVEASLFRGATENGLAVARYSLGPYLDARIGPVGLGLGFFTASNEVTRTTAPRDITFLSTSIALRGTFDLVSWGARHAMFLGIRAFYGGAMSAELYGAGLLVGHRFRN